MIVILIYLRECGNLRQLTVVVTAIFGFCHAEWARSVPADRRLIKDPGLLLCSGR
jgi:hypothetical protein